MVERISVGQLDKRISVDEIFTRKSADCSADLIRDCDVLVARSSRNKRPARRVDCTELISNDGFKRIPKRLDNVLRASPLV